MASDRISDVELKELSARLTVRLEDELERTPFTSEELTELAERQRALAQVTDSPGQRRAFTDTAGLFEQEARRRAARSPAAVTRSGRDR